MDDPLFREYPGYVNAFTRNQAVGAIPNGTRVVKINSHFGDANKDGTLGVVLGSIKTPDELDGMGIPYFYFIEWDSLPRIAVGIVSIKVRRA